MRFHVRLDAHHWRRIHLCLAIAWGLTVLPTVIWWHDSILWVAFMSVYAIVVTHASCYQAARAEVAADVESA